MNATKNNEVVLTDSKDYLGELLTSFYVFNCINSRRLHLYKNKKFIQQKNLIYNKNKDNINMSY